MKIKILVISITVVLICIGIVGAYLVKKETNPKIASNATVFYVYPAITDDKILPISVIPDQYESNSIFLDGSPGEYRPASFIIRALRDIHSISLSVSDLSGVQGTISRDSIDVRVVKSWYQSGLDVHETSSQVLTPELLLKDDSLVRVENQENYVKLEDGTYKLISSSETPGSSTSSVTDLPIKDSSKLQPVDIADGFNKQMWISLKIPDKAKTGEYSGKIKLTSEEGFLGDFQIKLTVLPITLVPSRLTYSIYYTGILDSNWPQGSISSHYKSETQFKKEMQNLLSHGVTNPTVYQPFDSQLLSKVLAIRKDLGMDNSSLYYLGLGPWGYEPVDEVKKVIEFAHNSGVGDVYFYGKDEASGADLIKQRTAWQAIREAGGKMFVAGIATQGDIKGNFALMGDITDLFICRGMPSAEEAANWHASHFQIFSYANPQVGMELPETYRRNYGMLLWQKEYDGAMNWAYQSGFGNIWNDFDDPSYRDEVFTYPTVDGVIDTIQWEGFREGVNDTRYLATLLQTINNAKLKGKDTSPAENWLAELKKSDLSTIDPDSIRQSIIQHILLLN
jgi:hypothetical protein